jgi:hypothetical protein
MQGISQLAEQELISLGGHGFIGLVGYRTTLVKYAFQDYSVSTEID